MSWQQLIASNGLALKRFGGRSCALCKPSLCKASRRKASLRKAWSAIVGQTKTSVRQDRSGPRIKSEGMLLLIVLFGRYPSSGARGGD
jgi:hypothetical protein